MTLPLPAFARRFFTQVGQYALLLAKAFQAIGEVKMYRENLLKQMVDIGVMALPVVMLASAFGGIVTTVQSAYQLDTTFYTESAIGAIVVPTIMLELAALMTGLVMAARLGARIAAEIGTMRVTEQIDALEAMGINATAYLVLPRVLAAVVMFPVLWIGACAVGVYAGGMAGDVMGLLPIERFIAGARVYFLPFDAFFGMLKTLVFGFIIASVACWKGFYTKAGAAGVGSSTTEAVVASCVAILIADYVIAVVLLGI
ncbi:MAG: ABC transporter permease [Bacteroidota bacterium]